MHLSLLHSIRYPQPPPPKKAITEQQQRGLKKRTFNDECSICGDVYQKDDNVIFCECLQYFHEACILRNINEYGRSGCPGCRRELI